MFWEPLKEDEMRRIIDFIENGNASVLDTDIPSRFTGLFFAFQKKQSETIIRTQKENQSLRRAAELVKKDRSSAAQKGEFADLNIDSVLVARALIYCVQTVRGTLSRAKLMYLLYETYAVWLASHGERIFLDRPEAQESGPWFWRVSKNILSLNNPEGKEAFSELHSVNPGVAQVVWNVAKKYGDMLESTMRDYLAATKPVQECRKENNGGKWNMKYSDTSIYNWKCWQMGK